MAFAIIETGGKQYKVSSGDVLKIEKLPAADGPVVFDKVLLVDDGSGAKIGTPYIDGAKVTAERVKDGRHDKITVVHYKNKIRYKKINGHRQPFTEVKIGDIK